MSRNVGRSLVLIVIHGFVCFCPSSSAQVLFRKHVQNITFYRHKLDSIPATDKLSIKYNLRLPYQPCCALVSFITKQTINDTSINYDLQCYEKSVSNTGLSTQYLIYLDHGNPFSGCTLDEDNYICKGTRLLYFGYKVDWYFDIGFECGRGHLLDVFIEMEFVSDFESKCEELTDPYCENEFNYNMTLFPNLLAQVSQVRAHRTLEDVKLIMDEALDCYQVAKEFICFSLFPPCANGERTIPCNKMCKEIKTACAHLLRTYRVVIHCGIYPSSLDPEVCYYKPILCSIPKNPEFGKVTYSERRVFNVSEYICHEGYHIKGERRRFCMYSGHWNGTEPICIPDENINIKAVITGTIFIVLVIIVLLVSCVYYRRLIHLVLMYNRLGAQRFYHVAQGKESLFLTYSSEDQELVQHLILPTMKFELPTWNTLTYQESFVGGQKILDSIHKGIWESHAVVAFLTQNYIDSHWCRYEFTEGQTRSISDNVFKFIIIIPENGLNDNDLFDGMPENIRNWVKGRVYLQLGERLFWNKLRRALAQ